MSTTLIEELPIRLVFLMINNQLETPINKNDVVVGDPKYITGKYNTAITIAPKIRTPLYGNFIFKYNRIDFDTLEDMEFKRTTEQTLLDFLPLINKEPIFNFTVQNIITGAITSFDSSLTEKDIINKPIKNFVPNSDFVFMDLQSVNGSYLFTGKKTIKIIR